jgi:hypothetical protein
MGLSLATLISELRAQLGVDSDDMPDAEATLLLNRSYWAVLNKFDFKEKEQSYVITTVDGTFTYALDLSTEAVQRLYIRGDSDTETHKLDQITEDTYSEWHNTSSDLRARPTHYVRYGSDIKLWPTPDDEYTIIADHLAVLSDIPSAGPAVPQEWHEIVLMGGVWRGHMKLREYQQAYAVKNMMKDEIEVTVPAKAKEETDNRYAAISIPIPRNKF